MEFTDILSCLSKFYPMTLNQFRKLSGLDVSQLREVIPNFDQLVARSEKLYQYLKKEKINLLHPLSPNFPTFLNEINDPPLFLTYVGFESWLSHKPLSVVGSREPTENGRSWLDQNLGLFLKNYKYTIISGAARGIDQKAHAVALRCGRPTVAFLPSGINATYPRDFKSWYKKIFDTGGAVMSEYFPDEEMLPHNFHRRNRLIVGISQVLLVVEAKRRSGSMMSARLALDSGRDVGVVPGSPLDPHYGGNLDLIFDGGFVIRDHMDLASLVENNHRIFNSQKTLPLM